MIHHRIIHRSVYLLLFKFLLFGCTAWDEIPDYIKKLPRWKSYTYRELDLTEQELPVDTLVLSLWYHAEQESSIVLNTPTDILKVDSTYWVSDPFSGSIYNFSKDGHYLGPVTRQGKGPNETMRPISLEGLSIDGLKRVFILDNVLSSVLVVNRKGEEISRISTPYIDRAVFTNWLDIVSPNELYIPTFMDSLHTVVQIDSSGRVNGSRIARLIPLGFQPAAFNTTFYRQNTTGSEVFAYSGLPLLFFNDHATRTIVNLLPHESLSDLNPPMTPIKSNKPITVKGYIRSIQFNRGTIWIHFKNLVLLFSPDGTLRKVYYLFTREGNEVSIQTIVYTGENLFFIDRLKQQIYTTPLPID